MLVDVSNAASRRYTQAEVAAKAEFGLDIAGVRSETELAGRIEDWVEVVAEAKPDLLETLAAALDAQCPDLMAEADAACRRANPRDFMRLVEGGRA